MKKALFITMHPLGLQTGGSIASSNFLKVVLEAFDGQVRVVASADSADYVEDLGANDYQAVPARSFVQKFSCLLRGVCSDRFSPYLDNHIEQLLDGVSHVVLDGSMLGRFAAVVKAVAPEVHVTQLHHNCERKYYADTNMPWWLRFFMGRVIDNNQGGGWHAADLNLTFTEQDVADLTEVYGRPAGQAEVFGYYEECQVCDILSAAKPEGAVRLVITGNMSVKKGYEGAVWFVEEILPHLKDVSLTIAGRKPHQQLVDASAKCSNVELIANPPDMLAVLKDADIFVNPSSVGSGIKVRNFDGLRNGLPVICHVGNAHGFEQLPKDVFATFTDATTFNECLGHMSVLIEANSIRAEVQRVYQLNYGLDSGVKNMSLYLNH